MKHLFSILALCSVLNNYAYFQSERSTKENLCKNVMKEYKACLENSIWIVPPETLLSYKYENNVHTPVTDQTVWVIHTFNQGYFWGDAYTSINKSSLSHRHLMGSVTLAGDVYITFYPVASQSQSTDLVNGIGKITRREDGSCFFVMQMNSAQNELIGLTHWSYMISVTKKDKYYKALPGVDISVHEFLKKFSK